MPGGRKQYHIDCEKCDRRVYQNILGQRLARRAARYHIARAHGEGQVLFVDAVTGVAKIYAYTEVAQ
jgi:hypothetical protein